MLNQPVFWLIIPAAGLGTRFNHEIPKQYYQINDRTILEHTLQCFWGDVRFKKIIIPISESDSIYPTLKLCHERIQTVPGGMTRAQSVLNALLFIKQHAKANDWVLTHDAVRCCFHPADLNRMIETLQKDEVGGVLATPVVDTLKMAHGVSVSHTVPRMSLWHAQTPQMFRFGLLLEALKTCIAKGLNITDEAFAVEQQGLSPKLVKAQYPNPKLTYKKDLAYMSSLLLEKVGSI